MIKLTPKLDLSTVNTLSLVANYAMQREMSESLNSIESEVQLHHACISMFNAIAEKASEDGDPSMVMLLNFLGLAIEKKLNIAAMLEESDRRVLEFKTEMERRGTNAKAQANRPAAE